MTESNLDENERTQLTQDGQPITANGKAAEFKPGDIVGGAYEVLSFIGAGGMGNVYRVRHTTLKTEYALKTLSAEQVTDLAWRRFQNEAQAIARMNHPNVVGIYNLDLHEKTLPYYVMDLLRGDTLLDKLKVRPRLPVSEALPIFVEACAGIGYAHKKGIVHRDIKPGNIVILDTADASGARIKIVDFGIAKLSHTRDLANQQLTNVGEICGSPFYMSPEQSQASKIDARSDIYSLGCTLFETLTGAPPFRGRNATDTMIMHHSAEPPSLSQVCPEAKCPAALEEVLAKCLAKAPMDRYQNMEMLAQDLKAIAEGKTGLSADEDRSPSGTKIGPLVIMASIVILLIGTAGTIFWINGQAQHPNTAAAAVKDLAQVVPTKLATETPGTTVADNQPPPTAAQLADKTPYSSYFTKADGVPWIRFQFPTDRSLGSIHWYHRRNTAFACRGVVEAPANIELLFVPNEQVSAYPQFIDRFRPTDLSAIELSSEDNKDYFDNTTIEHIGRLTDLRHLRILYSERINNESLKILDRLPNLVSLSLRDNSHLTVMGLSKSALVHRLREITVETSEPLTPLFAAIKGTDKLQFLDVSGLAVGLPDFHYIGTFSHLNTFKANYCSVTDEELAELANLRNLLCLEVDGCLLTEKSAPVIQKILTRAPKSLRINATKIGRRQYTALVSKLKGLKIN